MFISVSNKRASFFNLLVTLALFASVFGAQIIDKGTYTLWMFFLGVGLLFQSFLGKQKYTRISFFDIVIIIFTVYGILNYVLLTPYNFYQYFAWVYMGYVGSYYFFLTPLKEKHHNTYLKQVLGGIKWVALGQCFVSFLQYATFISSNNSYFEYTGTFTSPNTLAAWVSIAFVISFIQLLDGSKKSKRYCYVHCLMLICFLVLLVMSESRASWLACGVGILLIITIKYEWGSIIKRWSLFKKISVLLFFFGFIIASLFFAYKLKPDSVSGRKLIAQITLNEVVKKPLLGHGAYTFTAKYNKAKADYFKEKKRPWEQVKVASFGYSTFNDYLNVVFEFGFIGFFIGMALLVCLWCPLRLHSQNMMEYIILLMLMIYALFSYPLKEPHLLSLGIFAAALITAKKNDKTWFTLSNKVRFGGKLFLGIALIGVSLFKINAELDYIKFKTFPETASKEAIVKLYRSLNDIGYSDFRLGKVLIQKKYTEEGVHYMERGVSQYPLPEFCEVLALQYLQLKDYAKADSLMSFNVYNEPFRYKPLLHRLFLKKTLGDTLAQKRILHEIIYKPVKIPSQKILNYKQSAKKYLEVLNKISD